nr:hypothetical protein [Tanacetum cinerariifolium]
FSTKATAKIAKQDQRIQAREEEIKRLDQEIKSLRAVEAGSARPLNWKASASIFRTSKLVTVSCPSRVEQRCVKMDARLDKSSVDFDEELYPHMLTTIAGRRWVIRHGVRLAVMKCPESPKLRQTFANVVSVGLVKAGLKKKKCKVVCRTHRISSAHHDRSDDIPVSVSTIAPQGLAILLADAATQTEVADW